MSSQKPTPNFTVVFLSPEDHNLTLVLRQLCKNFGWGYYKNVHNVEDVLTAIHRGKADVVIIDHSADIPAVVALRGMLADELACITPTLVILPQDIYKQKVTIERICESEVIAKPITPTSFGAAADRIRKRWIAGEMKPYREVAKLHLKENNQTALKRCTELTNHKKLGWLASIHLAHSFAKLNKFPTAEKMLLMALKQSPTNFGILLALSQHYIQAAMPWQALRLISSAYKSVSYKQFLFFDMLQAFLLMGRYEEAFKLILGMEKQEFCPKFSINEGIKLAYALGYTDHFERLSKKVPDGLAKKIVNAFESKQQSEQPKAS